MARCPSGAAPGGPASCASDSAMRCCACPASSPARATAGAICPWPAPPGYWCRDPAGPIIALKVRRDGDGDGRRYFYLSSATHGGPGPGAPVHVPLGVQATRDVWRLTEGELKADVATLLSGTPTISVPGATCWRLALDSLKA